MPKIKRPSEANKIFVLDTSVILYDHNAFLNFQEHDVAIPIQVLEELDNHKAGNETRNYEARNFIRIFDELSKNHRIHEWTSLKGEGAGRIKVIIDEVPNSINAETVFGEGKFDHRILNGAISLQERNMDRKVVLVSKDICLRLKAKALGLPAEDYSTGKIKNLNELRTGCVRITDQTDARVRGLAKGQGLDLSRLKLQGNHFLEIDTKRSKTLAFYKDEDKSVELVREREVFNISPRNPEQLFALHALMDPQIQLVTIQGNAGTGKTLLALASALEQRRSYRQIYITRPTVPLSNRELGFLPGDIKSKVDPYMAPIWDNLKFIKDLAGTDEKKVALIDDLIANEKILVTPLAFIRGRSLVKIFFIVDEAQNLTPHEVKTIISRAGEETKIVFTGDIYQIDTPYLDAESNGLAYLIDKAKSHPLYAHITLQKGERSELANLANELL